MLPNVQIKTADPAVKIAPALATSTNDNDIAAAAVAYFDWHIQSINILVPALKKAKHNYVRDREQLLVAIGEHILAIKAAAPNDWEMMVKAKCGLSRSRSYELMAIADGTKSTEQTRRATNARKIKHRENNQVVRSGTDKKEQAAATTQMAELQAAHARQIDRFKAEIAQLSDAEALRFERDQLRAALSKIDKLLAEARGLTEHFVYNRSDIIAKINRAQILANSALRPGKGATGNFASIPIKRAA
jgi:hypothetical protein